MNAAGKWVDVRERLPKIGNVLSDKVLLRFNEEPKNYYIGCYHVKGVFLVFPGDYIEMIDNVTHWAEINAPELNEKAIRD